MTAYTGEGHPRTNPKASRTFQLISRSCRLVRLSLAWYTTDVPATTAEAAALHRHRIARPGPGVVGDITGRSDMSTPAEEGLDNGDTGLRHSTLGALFERAGAAERLMSRSDRRGGFLFS